MGLRDQSHQLRISAAEDGVRSLLREALRPKKFFNKTKYISQQVYWKTIVISPFVLNFKL